MRTSTKCIRGEGQEDFKRVFASRCPAGKIAVVAQDKEEGDKLIRFLGRDYDAALYTPSEARQANSAVRFVIGMGGSGVIPAVKHIAVNASYAFYPTYFDYRFLYAFDGVFTLPEFVYLSDDAAKGDGYTVRLYVAAFQLYAEACFLACYASALPYRDAEAEAYVKQGERILSGTLTESEFYDEALRYVRNVAMLLFERKKTRLVTERVIQRYGLTQGERFTAVRFLLLTLKNFTKRRLCDILVPSERPVFGGRYVDGSAFDAATLPDDAMLDACEKKVRFLTELPETRPDELAEALTEGVGDFDPLFAIIHDEGITEAINDERLKRGKSIFI